MNKEGITVAGNLIADVVYTIDVYPQKGNLTWMRNPVAHTGGINNLIIDFDDPSGHSVQPGLRSVPGGNRLCIRSVLGCGTHLGEPV